MCLLEIRNISMNYHSAKCETKALSGINFKVNEGEFISILGPSGCGKSTLLNIISGLLEPSEGSILYRGEDIKNSLDKIGYMFQKDHLFEWNTVWENVILGLKIKKILNNESKERVENLLESYGLEKFKNHYPRELSGGMRQRVALIRTLALNPEILFLDEPLSGLDANSVMIVKELLEILAREGKTIFYSSHIMDVVEKISHRIVLLNDGKIVADGSFKELKENCNEGSLEEIFNDITGFNNHKEIAQEIARIIK